MLAGTVLGQAASVLLSPALTRLYTPDEFGYLSVYTAVLTILGVVAVLGFDLAIPIAASEAELANLVAAGVGALVGTTGLLSLIVWLAPNRLLTQLWVGPLTSYRCLLPIGFACVGGYYVMVAAATRVSAFRQIAWTRVSQGLSGPISQIALGVLGAGAPGLAIGFVIGQSSGTFLLFSRVILEIAQPARGAVLARRHGRGAALRPLPAIRELVAHSRYGRQRPDIVPGFFHLLLKRDRGLHVSHRACHRPAVVDGQHLAAAGFHRRGGARGAERSHQTEAPVLAGRAAAIPARGKLDHGRESCGWLGISRVVRSPMGGVNPVLRALSVAYLAQAVLHPVSTLLQIMERQILAAAWQAGRLALVLATVLVAWRLGLSAVTALWLASLAQLVSCVTMLALIAWSIHQIEHQWATSPTRPAAQ